MKESYKILEGILPYPTEGDGDDIIDLDLLLNTGVGADHNQLNNNEDEDKNKDKDKDKGTDDGTGGDNSSGTDGDDSSNNDGDDSDEIDNLTLLQGLNADDLDDDQKAIKQEILNKFKGESFDANGNVVDKNGNIVAEFDKVDKFINAEPIFDDKGNQVDESGKIIKTASQVKFEQSAIGGVINELPYDLKDENGNPIEYPDTLEGYTKLAKDVAAIELENFKKSFFESNPTLREVAKHLLSGNELETFNNPVDYSKIDTKSLTADDKLELIKKSFIVSGVDKDTAADMVNLIKEKGGAAVEDKLSKALSTLDSNSKAQQKARDEAYQQSIKEENQKVVQYWGKVKQEIDTGKLGSIDIPKNEQEAFFKYISTPVNSDGDSQEILDQQKEGLNADLMMRYYRFKKYNVGNIVKSEVNKEKIKTLRDRINKAHKSKSSSSSNNFKNTKGVGDVSLDELLG